jgi:hypothetical protein
MAEKARRRRRTARIAALVLLVLALAAAAMLWPKPSRGALSVASVSTAGPTGVVRGVLAASRSGDRVCYALTADGTTAVLRFVPGWSADKRLGLRDPSGAVVALPGDTLVLLGAPASIGTVAGCSLSGRIWTVTGIKSSTPS